MLPPSGCSCAGDHAEQGGLAHAVGTDDADDASLRQAEADILVQQPVAVGLAQAAASMTLSPRRGPGGM
jgi:hypothetical protein